MKFIKKIILSLTIILFSLNINPYIANANTPKIEQTKNFSTFKPSNLPSPGFGGENVSTKEKQQIVLKNFFPAFSIRFLIFVTIASLLGILYGGFLYISDIGAEQNLEQAKKAITYSIIGLIVAFMSYAIVQIINVLPLSFN